MTRRRWIADEVKADRAALTGQNAAHLARVLRARVGQEFDISTGQEVRRGRVVSVGEERVEFELGDVIVTAAETSITVLLAVFKFDRFEWAVEKCTELGAGTIVPVISRRTDAHLAQAAGKRVERWQRIAREAAQQSRRVAPPEIPEPVKLKEAISGGTGLRIVLAEVENGDSLPEVMATAERYSTLTLAVGPEGGWTEDELKAFREAGWRSVSLGSTILRAETAAVAATAIASACKR